MRFSSRRIIIKAQFKKPLFMVACRVRGAFPRTTIIIQQDFVVRDLLPIRLRFKDYVAFAHNDN